MSTRVMSVRHVSRLRELFNATIGENWETTIDDFPNMADLTASMASAAEGNPDGLTLCGVRASSAGEGITIALTGNGQHGDAHAEFIATVHEWMPRILASLEYSLESEVRSPAVAS